MNDAVKALVEALGGDCVRPGDDVPLRNQRDATNAAATRPLASAAMRFFNPGRIF